MLVLVAEPDREASVELAMAVSTLLVLRAIEETLSTIEDADTLSRLALELKLADAALELAVTEDDDALPSTEVLPLAKEVPDRLTVADADAVPSVVLALADALDETAIEELVPLAVLAPGRDSVCPEWLL